MAKKVNKKGFTLIELIIVVAIMAVLVALLAPNVLKYLEKSKVGKDINSLDSVRLAIEAELADEELSSLTTGKSVSGDTTKVKGIYLKDIAANLADDNFDKLAQRLFGEGDALSTTFLADDVFSSKVARETRSRIAVFIDENGGVAVAAIKAEGGIASFNGSLIAVGTKIDFSSLDTSVQALGGGQPPQQPPTN